MHGAPGTRRRADRSCRARSGAGALLPSGGRCQHCGAAAPCRSHRPPPPSRSGSALAPPTSRNGPAGSPPPLPRMVSPTPPRGTARRDDVRRTARAGAAVSWRPARRACGLWAAPGRGVRACGRVLSWEGVLRTLGPGRRLC